MNKISCNVCMDLMPLVKDGVASEDSCRLVKEHMADCPDCAAAFDAETPQEGEGGKVMNDKAVVAKLKRQLMLCLAGAMLAGALLGMVISNGMGMFYNIIIMPAIGGLGYILLRKKSYLVPPGLFLFVFLWVAIREILGGYLGYGSAVGLIFMSAWWSAIYTALSIVGGVAAWLLHFAFRKEV